MNHALLATSLPFDIELGSLLLANMLSALLDHEIVAQDTAEAAHEPPQNHRAPPQSVRLCLSPAVNSRPSATSSGEHGTTVRVAGGGTGTSLERSFDPDARPRPGQVGSVVGKTGGLRDTRGERSDRTSGA